MPTSNVIKFPNKKVHIIIAGGRDFNEYETLRLAFTDFLADFVNTEVAVISGMARGADLLGVQIAEAYSLPILHMPAEWDKYGKSAGYHRNADMANLATHLLAAWDGKSRGTMHMINIATEKKLITKVINY